MLGEVFIRLLSKRNKITILSAKVYYLIAIRLLSYCSKITILFPLLAAQRYNIPCRNTKKTHRKNIFYRRANFISLSTGVSSKLLNFQLSIIIFQLSA